MITKIITRKNIGLLFPYIVASFPLLHIFAVAKNLPIRVVLGPLFTVLLVSIGVFWVLKIITKNTARASLILSLGLIASLYYGFFYDYLFEFKIGNLLIGRHGYLYPLWGIFFLVLLWFSIFYPKSSVKLNTPLKLIALILIGLLSFEFLVFAKVKIRGDDMSQVISNQKSKLEPISPPHNIDRSNLPDIYYILPDQYASLAVLKEYFGYNSDDFRNSLEQKGFVVIENSRSNYSETFFSLASLLNMEYFDNFGLEIEETSNNFDPIIDLIKDSRVRDFLESLGYKYICLSPDPLVIGASNTSETVIETSFDTFMRQALKTTLLRPFSGRYRFKENKINAWKRDSILEAFDNLAKIPNSNIKEPKFVLFYIMSPHGPYVFGRNGEEISTNFISSIDYKKDMDLFLDQSIFIGKKIDEVVAHILKESERPPIIIIQSDHGVYLSPEIASEELRATVRTHNFTAFYLPNRDKTIDLDNIITVNTFRLIFDQYFGTDLGLLSKKRYSYDKRYPFRFEKLPDKE